MAKRSGRSGPSNPRRKTGVVRRRRALNAFRVDNTDVDQNARDEEEILDDGDEGVKSEDDEDIDSDEAFDEEDEERYSTFKFSGSSSNAVRGKQKAQSAGSSKDKEKHGESEASEGEVVDEDDDEVYMDLSEMLADGQSTNSTSKNVKGKGVASEGSDEESDEEESEEEEDVVLDDSAPESEQDDDQLDSLGAFVDSLASKKTESKPQPTEPSAPALTEEPSNELSISDIVASLTDPSLQSFRKSLAAQQTSKSKNVAQKLSVPLARPIQQKLEREAAYEETKAEISKWQPLVKANREADHLQFPLNEPQITAKQSTATLAGNFEPSTEMEKKIDEILRESGIKDEKDITSFEELALKKVSIDEVRQRQAELRAMRELMFRQDQKAKRIAKIKSKTYRRIHKREREREMERRMAEEGSDGEEIQDRRMKMEAARAKERMTLRHKNTGDWAKKMLSRGQHDLETRQAISEQIRRGDDLQRKILGDEDEDEESDSAEELEDLVRDPNNWGDDEIQETSAVRKGVMGMKFMTDAEERQRQVITQELAELRAAMTAGSDDEDTTLEVATSAEAINPGRKIFIPGDQTEQPDTSDDSARKRQEETGEEIELRIVKNPFHLSEVQLQAKNTDKKTTKQSQSRSSLFSTSRMEPSTSAVSSTTNGKSKSSTFLAPEPSPNGAPIENPWLSIPMSKQSKKKSPENRIEKIQKKRKADDLDTPDSHLNIDTTVSAIIEKLSAPTDAENDEDAPSMTYGPSKVAFQQIELINRAFAGDDLEADFMADKEAAIAEDAPKEEDLTLPGWGSWAGQGVKRRATEKKLIKKVPGIDASKRKDAKLKNVIINEKRAKANTKYLVTGTVPYPYETREQYERSLSMPVGPEFTTREMYQKMTKPRVSIKAGAVVNPLKAPFK